MKEFRKWYVNKTSAQHKYAYIPGIKLSLPEKQQYTRQYCGWEKTSNYLWFHKFGCDLDLGSDWEPEDPSLTLTDKRTMFKQLFGEYDI